MTVQDRVSYIADMMAALEWRGARSIRELADEWDLSRAYVASLAREAARRVHSHVGDPELVSTTVQTALARALDEAEADRDWRAVVSAALAWQKLSALGAREDPGLADSGLSEEDL